MIEMHFPLTLKAKMMLVFSSFRTLQRPPSFRKIFLECFLTVQLSTGHLKCATTLNFVFVQCSISSQQWREKNNILIDDHHGCKATAMTPPELLKYLKDEGDSTHTAISIYL